MRGYGGPQAGTALNSTILGVVGEHIDLPDASVETVICSLVLCTVGDPGAVLAEIRRILTPGGRFGFAEHVAAKPRTPTRFLQRVLRRPWAWVFEGCSCERDLRGLIAAAGFATVDITTFRIDSPLIPFNPHIAGTADRMTRVRRPSGSLGRRPVVRPQGPGLIVDVRLSAAWMRSVRPCCGVYPDLRPLTDSGLLSTGGTTMPNTSDPQPLDLSMTEAIRKDGAFTTYLELAGSDGALGTRRAVKVAGTLTAIPFRRP